MEEEKKCVEIIVRVLDELFNPTIKISELQVANLVKYVTGLTGK